MANVEIKDGLWRPLGRFKSVKCRKTMGVQVCTVKFSEGSVTLTKSELDKVCKKV